MSRFAGSRMVGDGEDIVVRETTGERGVSDLRCVALLSKTIRGEVGSMFSVFSSSDCWYAQYFGLNCEQAMHLP